MDYKKMYRGRIYFYLPDDSLNDATKHYVSLVEKAFLACDFEVLTHKKLDFKPLSEDFLFVIRIKDFINIYFRSKSSKIIFWFQGLLAEEHLMMFGETFFRQVKCKFFDLLENTTLRRCLHAFYVSDFMKTYLDKKHSYTKDSFTIIPCYNKTINEKYFKKSAKKDSSFVYAGGLFSWQCFEQTLAIYKEVESNNQNAFLTVLTKQKDLAEKLINKACISNFKILYVPVEKLDEELSKHKYGFMLRENNTVNSCATPTKMNTYLSVGLMPIYTDAISAFNTHLNLGDFEVKINLKVGFSAIANEIIRHDSIDIDYDEYFILCKQNFQGFFDDAYNINKINKELIAPKIILS